MMNLDKVRVTVKKLNYLLDHPDMASDFNQQLDQLLAELDAARKPPSSRMMRSSHRPPEKSDSR